ncbi:MAG TPA: carboxymuconolactone decarboxylase family protein [Thermoanaerobaculia bacterium]|nr:carboxymuconolactone decarboxylase family protein [Thermoanaerobaculia bacterium]
MARIPPLADDEATPEQREQLEKNRIDGQVYNIFRTLAHHPDLLRRWTVFAGHVLRKSTLPARDREIAILRVGWLCAAEYEWGQHVLIGLRSGLDDDDIRRIAEGPRAAGLSERDSLLLQATDELVRTARIADDTWSALAVLYDRRQLIDLVFAVGQYNLVSMALNTLEVERDPGVPGFVETVGRRPSGS